MLINRLAVAALAITACSAEPAAAPDAPVDDTEQFSTAPSTCDVLPYRCYPNQPGADLTCGIACGDPSHCVDYTPGEYIWCELHPGVCLGHGFRCCDRSGNPRWDTRCARGPRP